MENTFRTILEHYMDERFVEGTPIGSIRYDNPDNFVKLENVDLDPRVNTELRTLQTHPTIITSFMPEFLCSTR